MPAHAIPVFLTMSFLIIWGVAGFHAPVPRLASGWVGEISCSHPIERAISGDAGLENNSDQVADMKAALAGLDLKEPQ